MTNWAVGNYFSSGENFFTYSDCKRLRFALILSSDGFAELLSEGAAGFAFFCLYR